ncbi:glycosyltransferase [Candidatus Mycobacterium wuenschmannii]|uniref:Glycosyltransferase n=1 Tax=Candidatus Mycobacterium wuenschmannii TaxID=3027808 RepID=A0ABY8W0Y6_9MYCO|nr:glycosyltransferase [Candidatus Mycobacterium wuenschmannii]WIM88885.1 glycosyltransferase [Candidatus Mycobacterium wuenschmannii]
MRLAVLGPSHHPVGEPFAGGQERFTADLVRGLRRRGHHLELFALPGTDPELADRLHLMPALPDLSEVASADPNMPEPLFLHDQFVYLAAMRDLLQRNDIDAVLNESLHQLPLALASALRMPTVTTLHTPPFPWMEIGAWLAGPSACFVAVSQALQAQWSTLTDSHVIYNGVDPDRFPIGPGGRELLWVGRLTPDKGADIAISVAQHADRELRLAGPISDPDWFGSVIRPMLGPSVSYVGPVSGRELADLYGSSAATLVTPRWEEPFCLVAVETQMCGTPVVGIRRGGLPEVVTGPGGVLVEPGQRLISRLAEALPGVSQISRAEVADHARSRWDVSAMIDQYERLCDLLRRQ